MTTFDKTPARKIPATVITGFLGAGKTTLLRNLVERAGGRKIALMINEFGDLGVDGALLEACGLPGCAEGELFELANGCICCTVADDFLPTMRAILDRPEPPDHIVIETSGLALPKPLVQAFNWPEVRTRVSVDGVVAVIDAPAVAEGRFAADPDAIEAQRLADDNLEHDTPLEELYEDQLACADVVLINKTDLLDAEQLERVVSEVARQIRPGVAIVRTEYGRIAPETLLGLGAAAEDDLVAKGVLGVAGTGFRGHEFHYATTVREGSADPLFEAEDASGTDLGQVGRRLGRTAGSFIHLIDRAGG